ncbi:hypothetical protein BC829DRAFT_104118 [Chytridium lagenaria]|nr:hypothetical protein BC829DRAFT_104118 [Chytridium lagenaria]
MVLGMAAEALSNQGSERLVRKSSIGFSNPPSPHLSLSRTPAVRDGECKCKVTKDLADKTSDTTSILKMLYTASADDKSTSGSRNQSQREIKFPFNILEDTATDVVSEMVKESLVKEEDEPFVRRRLEEAIKEFFFFNKPGSVSGSSSSSPQLPRSQSGTELNDALQRNVSTGMLANLSLQSFPAVEAQYGDRFSPSFPRVTDESVENPEFVTAVPHVSDPQGPARTYMSRRFNLPNTDGVFFE